jgi:hypothetical protein
LKRDLHKPIPEVVRRNQAPPTGQRVLLEVDGIVSEYAHVDNYERAEHFDARLRAEIDWIERFTSHAPSIGTHYEKILSDLVSEYLPSSVNVGTGFIYDSLRETVSPQIDLLCYNDQSVSPIYQRDDFIIVQPEMVMAVCEVKKTLKCNDLKSLIKKTMGCNMGTMVSKPRGVQDMSIFAYSCPAKTKTIVQNVAEATEEFLSNFVTRTKGGDLALLGIRQLCLPSIYMHDREEFVSVSVERKLPNSIEGQVRITTLKSSGPNGISPFLGSLSTITDSYIGANRDHCSSFLQEIVDEKALDVPVMLLSYMGSTELIRYFPEARSILRKNKAYGVHFSSFEDPGKHGNLDSFTGVVGFSWCIDERATQQGAPADAEKQRG